MNTRHHIIHLLGAWLTGLLLLSACVQEDGLDMAKGKLQFRIGRVSSDTQTRLTPAELGKPVLDQFKLKLQRTNSDFVAYEGPFQQQMDVRVGNYIVTATCGENVPIGRDTPYYIGTAPAVVQKDQSTSVSIPCKVGNALVSVQFGRDDKERARFSRFYSTYGLLVRVGDYSLAINQDQESSSIYFPAGSQPEILFYGSLVADNNRVVSMPLEHASLPKTFQAADHARLTLTLPDPESALGPNISKVELTQVTLDETIPVSWLPIPSVTATHQYHEGMLKGTDLSFSMAYPGMTWEARVSSPMGDTVRIVKGTGSLSSLHSASIDWPYLPDGRYKATFFIHSNGKASRVGSRQFIIGKADLRATVSGYTSYDKYLESKIADANACDGLTLYAPMVSLNIVPALAEHPRYGYKLEYGFDGTWESTNQNTHNLPQKKLDAKAAPYVLAMKAYFAGAIIMAQREFFITGIPFMSEPPTTTVWDAAGQDIADGADFICMGGSNFGTGSSTMYYRKVAIPAGTHLTADYKFINSNGAITTRTTIRAQQQLIVEQHGSAYKDITVEETRDISLDTFTDYIEVYNSNNGGKANTDVYRVGMRYR